MQDLKKFLSCSAVSHRLGLSSRRVLQLVEEGKLTFVKTPLGRLFDPREVERLVKLRTSRGKKSGLAINV